MNSTLVTDPVCGLTLPLKTAEARSDYNGQADYFCYAACKVLFDWNPEKYARPTSQTSQEMQSP